MRTRIIGVVGILLACIASPAGAAGKSENAAYQSNRAIIVVTGLRSNEDPENYRQELSVAEGAAVQVVARGGATREKKTEAFPKAGKRGGGAYFTADFEVELETTYDITMTFKDGTAIRIADYRLPRDWKTHFYFHGTTGTLSPSSILRIGEDPRTKLRCHVYAVYPMESYRKLGGRQLQ